MATECAFFFLQVPILLAIGFLVQIACIVLPTASRVQMQEYEEPIQHCIVITFFGCLGLTFIFCLRIISSLLSR